MITRMVAFILIATSHAQTAADTQHSCGTYLLKGKLVSLQNHQRYAFIVNGGNRSEIQFSIPNVEDFKKISGHLNQPLELVAHVKKPIVGMRGEIFDLSNIRLGVLRPLADQPLQRLEALECHK